MEFDIDDLVEVPVISQGGNLSDWYVIVDKSNEHKKYEAYLFKSDYINDNFDYRIVFNFDEISHGHKVSFK